MRRVGRLAAIDVGFATASVVVSCAAVLVHVAARLRLLPPLSGLGVLASSAALFGLAILFDRRTRALARDDVELLGSWPIEAARRRRKRASELLGTLLGLAALGTLLQIGLALVRG